MNRQHFINSLDKFKKFFIKTNVSDVEGHYDIDGVSMDQGEVVVAGEGSTAETLFPTQYLPLSEKSLEQIQKTADATSIKLKNQKAPAEDGKPAKGQYSSARYDSKIEEYLQFENAGD